MHDGMKFKRHELPDLDRREYRIVQGLDAAAALVTDDGVVAAAAEERFTGEKTTGAFPVNAIEYCLREAGLTMGDVDFVAHGFNYGPSAIHDLSAFTRRRYQQVYSPDSIRALLARHYPGLGWQGRFVPVPHHLAHAASTYHLSGFDDSLILVADGSGETESMTVARGRGRAMEIVGTAPASQSLGTLYGAVTLYLGFEFGMDEYKVMGLAPYGDPTRYADKMMRLIRLHDNGGFVVPGLAANRGWQEHETLRGTQRLLTELFGPPREPGTPVTQHHMDVAAAVQAGLEATLLHVLRHHAETTGERNLCLAGGVALNCTANGLLARSQLFDDLFVQPAAGDDGSALGAALHTHVERSATNIRGRMTMPYWGPGFTQDDVSTATRRHTDLGRRNYADTGELVKDVARLLADEAFVAWFQGRMEFGPRALGNRSILADPRDASVRDRLNAVVKQREDFRPFAPVVRHEDAREYFELADDAEAYYEHMLLVAHTRPQHRALLSAVTHVDGTARVQVLRRKSNPLLWELLGEFGALTGVPVLLNTSFNLRGQPIIRDPDTALDTFVNSRLDYLVLESCLLHRASMPVPPRPVPAATA